MANYKQQVKKLLKDIESYSYDQKVAAGIYCLSNCFAVMTRVTGSSEKSAGLVCSFLATTVSIDGIFSSREKQFLWDVFKQDPEQVLKRVEKSDPEIINVILDRMLPSDSCHFHMLALLLASIDGNVDKKEMAFLTKLIE